ncbi:hypothetical protein KN1_09060 [Stygiolobus caldivivus]|uniref:Uncharacterized protein n=1 Tax=Stygiolobus caldivivus TaxID=2824673 RepID=A0A8D5U689_9CREN|nr:hypothetical protein KN1_09060 [Stygiolobus caldivivus]
MGGSRVITKPLHVSPHGPAYIRFLRAGGGETLFGGKGWRPSRDLPSDEWDSVPSVPSVMMRVKAVNHERVNHSRHGEVKRVIGSVIISHEKWLLVTMRSSSIT